MKNIVKGCDLAILDTNVWIYICNTHSFQKDETGQYPHIKMFNSLKELVDNEDLKILTNDLIIEEWNRNKAATRKYINRLNGELVEKRNRLKMKIKNNSEESAQLIKAILEIEKNIERNEVHLIDVEEFLKDKTIKYPITNESKIVAADQAIAKKAPFTGKKSNSMADMVILLSGIDYIKKHYSAEIIEDYVLHPNSYFVSGNKSDFSSKDNEQEIHKDISSFMDEVGMCYFTNLGEFINIITHSNLISDLDIQNYNDFIDGDLELCPYCDENLDAYICFNKKVSIRDKNKPLYDDKQLRLNFVEETTEELNKGAYIETYEGICSWCGSRFIQCALCGEMLKINLGNEQCLHCGATYTTPIEYREKDIIYDLDICVCSSE